MAAGLLMCALTCIFLAGSNTATSVDDLSQKILAIEKKFGALLEDNQNLREENQKQAAKLDVLQEQNLKLSEKFDDQQEKLEVKFDNLREEDQKLKDLSQIHTKQIEDLENGARVEAERRQMTADTLFLATISGFSVSVGEEDPIIWDTVPLNPGGHFNPAVGMYTAPFHGYYQFTVAKLGNNYYGSSFIMVDEIRVALIEAYFVNSDNTPAGSGTINLELQANQVVRVENVGSDTLFGTTEGGIIYSWFTGHMLYSL